MKRPYGPLGFLQCGECDADLQPSGGCDCRAMWGHRSNCASEKYYCNKSACPQVGSTVANTSGVFICEWDEPKPHVATIFAEQKRKAADYERSEAERRSPQGRARANWRVRAAWRARAARRRRASALASGRALAGVVRPLAGGVFADPSTCMSKGRGRSVNRHKSRRARQRCCE
jgi:hypothetical protein